MAKITSLINLSSLNGISSELLDFLGVTDVILNADTALFIDPLLLSESRHKLINDNASKKYIQKFQRIKKFLHASTKVNDAAWKAAKKEFHFPEVSYTCLGYSSTINGSAWGEQLMNQQ